MSKNFHAIFKLGSKTQWANKLLIESFLNEGSNLQHDQECHAWFCNLALRVRKRGEYSMWAYFSYYSIVNVQDIEMIDEMFRKMLSVS